MKYLILLVFTVSMVYGKQFPSNFTKIDHIHKHYDEIMNIRQDILRANLRYQALVILLESTGKDIKAMDKEITDKRDQTKWKMRENHKMARNAPARIFEPMMMATRTLYRLVLSSKAAVSLPSSWRISTEGI